MALAGLSAGCAGGAAARRCRRRPAWRPITVADQRGPSSRPLIVASGAGGGVERRRLRAAVSLTLITAGRRRQGPRAVLVDGRCARRWLPAVPPGIGLRRQPGHPPPVQPMTGSVHPRAVIPGHDDLTVGRWIGVARQRRRSSSVDVLSMTLSMKASPRSARGTTPTACWSWQNSHYGRKAMQHSTFNRGFGVGFDPPGSIL